MAATATAAFPVGVELKIHNDSVAFASGLTPVIRGIFKMGEVLAHDKAYSLNSNPRAKDDIDIPEINKSLSHQVIKLEADNLGLVGHVLLPIELVKEAENKIDIKIVFKGTDDLAGIKRNLFEKGGAGHESFHGNKKAIIAQINEIIKQYREKLANGKLDLNRIQFSITIAGHSLGGADAQRMLLAIKEAIAQNLGCNVEIDGVPANQRDQFKYICKLRLFTFNSTGCSKTDHAQSELISGFITARKAEMNSQFKLDTELNIFYADGDGVQQTGGKHILFNASRNQALLRFVKARNIHTGQDNSNAAQKLYNSLLTLGSKYQIIKNPGILLACSGLGLYGFGASAIYASLTTMAGTALTYYDWYETANSGYSLYALYRATKDTHTAFYFTDTFANFRDRPLNHSFLLYTNENAAEQRAIQTELELRSPTAQAAHAAVANGYGYICRSRKKPTSGVASPITANASAVSPNPAASATASAATAYTTPPITWQLPLNTNSMKAHQSELAAAEAQVAIDRRTAERTATLKRARATYL